VSVFLGLILAILIHRLGRREGAVYRLILFIPVMLPIAVIGLLFTFMYNPEMGLINQFLLTIGADSLTKAWLENKETVLIAISAVAIWRMLGLSMMLIFAGLQQIPNSLLESSKLDGANEFKQIIHIVLPLIKPVILLSIVFTLIMNFKTYDLVFVMTGGGPGTTSKTVPIYMVDTAFTYNEFGYSSAIGFLFTLLVVVLILLVNKLFKGDSYEY
jgi:raffinose/stachyose/melibiose transport system permease protein